MNFPTDFYNYLNNSTLIEIKGGLERKTFLSIWMVTVGTRVFARSWNKSEKSWFTELLKTGVGQIKYGNKIINVKGKKLNTNDEVNSLINDAYLKKYTQKENIKYAEGITQPEYSDYTIELFYTDNLLI
ncbi:DUF2255 family protein [Aureibaculum sp. 2210JD6-5]|uniref:DUF2255 family protein n=1 Tax=Aureibaculum sp. 2210JD6-5 TaxID=3103957 RepID=UPI002AACFA70|nr:DUF2255 family protein [Aureibaculum sp. 2210JD6-5]MDY7394633.1 DUF2255 family protein [Aureibaculum sp. 2210JD6-5]